ncbi:hypothetical protein QP027_03395 [Corynebacterium breve]|uniref:Uncharacterized protein n=1 Tax=Corynebacterium breve TaxID=3049799 RepID=A0ABY8VFP0_9CORY|nr:DUF6882 domain-containing protein [Corynebacterium breve]WIM68454.1 hypothetical protein QP027_03395 [Corynebacterium breve]
MELGYPQSLQDIATDGAIAQSDIDASTAAISGPIAGIEFSGPNPEDEDRDALVELRIHHQDGRTSAGTGTRAALIRDNVWHWRTARVESFPDIAEFSQELPGDDIHVKATRTLFGNAQVFLAPHADGATSVVAMNGTPPTGPLRSALVAGAAQLSPELDTTRAVAAFAASRGLGFAETDTGMNLSDGTTIIIEDDAISHVGSGLTLRDTIADGVLTSTEHQFLFGGRYPDATVQLNLAAGRALVQPNNQHPFEVAAQVLATVSHGTATWAWADQGLAGSPAAQAAGSVRNFGFNNGIIALLRPTFPETELENLVTASKPITGMWTHTTAQLSPDTSAIVLLSGPELSLPAPSQAAVDATVNSLTDDIDRPRALAAYAHNRQLTLGADGKITV